MNHLSRAKWNLAFVATVAIGWGPGCSTSKPALNTANNLSYDQAIQLRKPELSRVGEGSGIHLSEAILKNLKIEELSDERRALVKYVAGSPRHSTYEECLTRFKNAPECKFLKQGWVDSFFEDQTEETDTSDAEIALKVSQRSTAVKMTKAVKKRHAKVVEHLKGELNSGQFAKLPEQIEGDYFRALKKLTPGTPELEQLTKNVLQQTECADPELYAYLGLKGEEALPNDEFLKNSMKLYSKADQCGVGQAATNKYTQISRFRFGLLSIMQNDCKQAEQVFNRLAKMGTNDYSSRALYWNAFCARSESKKEEFLASFDELFRMNPLGFHTLSLTHGDSLLIENLSKPIDPIVKTRTARDGQFNVLISLIEDLDRMGDHVAVYHLLAPVRKNPDYLNTLEPGVRLYLATFSYRSHDMISLFRVLDSVFRTQSEYVVDSTLKLFYPLKHFETMSANVKKVHPLLIAALVRQESAFQEGARSRVGAMGLMQLMPATARVLDRKVRKSQLLQADTNLRLGIQYFEILVDRYNGDVELALAAYNAGAEVVDRWQKRYTVKNRLLFLDLIPYAETRNYVTLIGRNYYWYTKIYAAQLKAANGIAQAADVEFRALRSE